MKISPSVENLCGRFCPFPDRVGTIGDIPWVSPATPAATRDSTSSVNAIPLILSLLGLPLSVHTNFFPLPNIQQVSCWLSAFAKATADKSAHSASETPQHFYLSVVEDTTGFPAYSSAVALRLWRIHDFVILASARKQNRDEFSPSPHKASKEGLTVLDGYPSVPFPFFQRKRNSFLSRSYRKPRRRLRCRQIFRRKLCRFSKKIY